MKRFLLFLAALILSTAALAKLSVRQPCSDGMVLQQRSQARVWGKAEAGRKVSVHTSWDTRSYDATADVRGFWQVEVATPAASYTHHEIRVTSAAESLTITDILVGEVWLASGQSNMEMPVKGFFNCPVEGAAEVISAAPLRDQVRMFKVPRTRSYQPVEEVEGQWLLCDPSTVGWMSATAFFFARKLNEALDVPVGILYSAYGGSKVESWLPREVVEQYPDIRSDKASIEALKQDYLSPFMMYNAMICPIRGYTVKGVIWYQGCSNVGADKTYAGRLAKMVSIWRADWGDAAAAAPFYQVEIAPFRYGSSDQAGKAALLRKAQHDACKMIPNSAIVVTNDLVRPYEIDQIHPARKREVGERLAYMALHRDYGMGEVPCYSPEAVRLYALDGDLMVELKNCPDGLDRRYGIEGLEIAGSDGIYHPVTSASYEYEARALRIGCKDIDKPCSARYGWGDFKPGNLHGTDGLPLAPFELHL